MAEVSAVSNIRLVTSAALLAYVASGILIAWGSAHMAPTRAVAASFGAISADNRRVLVVEWMYSERSQALGGESGTPQPRPPRLTAGHLRTDARRRFARATQDHGLSESVGNESIWRSWRVAPAKPHAGRVAT